MKESARPREMFDAVAEVAAELGEGAGDVVFELRSRKRRECSVSAAVVADLVSAAQQRFHVVERKELRGRKVQLVRAELANVFIGSRNGHRRADEVTRARAGFGEQLRGAQSVAQAVVETEGDERPIDRQLAAQTTHRVGVTDERVSLAQPFEER